MNLPILLPSSMRWSNVPETVIVGRTQSWSVYGSTQGLFFTCPTRHTKGTRETGTVGA